jgi:hypothetical protein
MSEHYQDRAAQVQAIGRARHWLERLVQLAQFENVVLRVHAPRRVDPRAGERQPPEPPHGPGP